MTLAALTLHDAGEKLRRRELTSVALTEAVVRSAWSGDRCLSGPTGKGLDQGIARQVCREREQGCAVQHPLINEAFPPDGERKGGGDRRPSAYGLFREAG